MPGVDRLDGLFRLKLRAQPCIQDVWRCQVQRGCHDKSGRWNWEATNPTLSIICLTKMLRCWLPQWLHGSNWRKSIRKLCRLTPSIPKSPSYLTSWRACSDEQEEDWSVDADEELEQVQIPEELWSWELCISGSSSRDRGCRTSREDNWQKTHRRSQKIRSSSAANICQLCWFVTMGLLYIWMKNNKETARTAISEFKLPKI